VGIFVVLIREIFLLNKALDFNRQANKRLHEKMSDKLAEVEIEKIHLEDRIGELEETVSLWQGQSRRLNRHVNTLTMRLNADFEESSGDEKTRESVIKFRSAA
jgi:hypothetical protein